MEQYIDRALSAKTDNRPSFQKMIKDSAKKGFDVILVWKLDRFARNRYDSAHYKSVLRKNGVKVVSATETISEGAEGILLESLLEGMAEYYSAELSEKVVRGLTENALKCLYNGGTLPIGYVIDEHQHFQIDPVTAPAVLEAFKLYANGTLMQQLADKFNLAGIRTTRNGKLDTDNITSMLHNRKYIGEYRYRDIVIPGGIPAIVPEELFNRVQERMAANKKAPAKHKAEDEYLLTTKLYCGKCKCYMVGESGTGRSGQVHRYYKCVSAKHKKGCDKKSVKKDWIENIVNALGKLSDEHYAKYTHAYEEEQRELSVAVAEGQEKLENTEQQSVDMRLLIKTLREMTDVKELTPTMVNSLIQRIEVHNNDKYDGHCHVKVDIYFTAVGMITIPTEKEIHAMMEEIKKNPNAFKLVA